MKIKQKAIEEIKAQTKLFEYKILTSKEINLSLKERKNILERFKLIKDKIPLAHSSNELLTPTYFLLSECKDLEGDIVELGSYKGGSTAKLSIIAKILGKKLYVFDSFEGLPENKENLTKTEMGYTADLRKGEFYGGLKEVKNHIREYGEIDSCIFIKGWYEDTLKGFNKKICAASCDVDLFESTKTCLKYIYPLIVQGGFFFSQDCHFPLINKILKEKYHLIQLTNRFGFIKKDFKIVVNFK